MDLLPPHPVLLGCEVSPPEDGREAEQQGHGAAVEDHGRRHPPLVVEQVAVLTIII